MDRVIEPPIQLIESVQLPAVRKTKLDNGVEVYLINDGAQDVIKIELLFKGGKWYEEKNLIADLTNRMLREGTKKYSAKQIADIFDFYGANMNYGAGFETAGGVLYTLTKHVDRLLPLLFDICTEANFPEEEFTTILANRKQRLAVDLKKNEFLSNRAFVSALYGQAHPYGRVTEFADFDAATTNDLRTFYKRFYNPAHLILIVSGKYNEDSVMKQLNQLFGTKDWKGEKANDNIAHPVQPSTELIHHTEKAESVQSAVVLGNISINKTHPDFLKLGVLNTVLGGYFGSRLMANIREEKGYTYGIYSSFVSYPHGGFFEIASEVGKHVRENTLKEIEHEINVLRTELIPEDELQIVKNYMSGKILRSIDGPMKFSETIKGLILYGQGTDYIQTLLKTVREVSAEELKDLANKYLDYSRMYKVTVG